MKNYRWIIACGLLVFSLSANAQKGYKIKVKIKGLKDTVCYLANYYGKKQYYKDTAHVDRSGNMVFEGNKPLGGGIYSVVLPSLKYFEIIIGEQQFALETDTNDLVGAMKIKGSEENTLFYDYLKFIQAKTQDSEACQKLLKDKDADKNDPKRKECMEKMGAIDKEIKAFRMNYIEKYPDMLVGKLFNGMREPEIPNPPKGLDKRDAQNWRYRYFKNHYWDFVDTKDDRLIRTPVFHNKLEKYFKQLVIGHPDTIVKEADYIMGLVDGTRDLFKYSCHFITNKYEKSKFICMDKVFVHMADNYYCAGKAFWVDSAAMKKICDRADELRPIRCGVTSPNIILPDSNDKWINMHQLDGELTILVFWDPDCGHCKKEIPKIVEIFKKYEGKSWSAMAVSSEHNKEWKKFINEKKMHAFHNVAVPEKVYKDQEYATQLVMSGTTTLESLNYHQTYDIFSTPQVYVMDKDKKIIAKRLDHNTLDKLLEDHFKSKEKP